VEIFTIRNLNFAYPEQAKNAISDLTLSVQPGEFLVLCGPSGCGKSTLLRQLKTVLAPHGRRSGEILFDGRNLDEIDQREQSEKIGFVQQSPENQIVTDKVWHELAFGLESLGYDTPTIRRRVAEMASFFGIQEWFYKPVTELSGGQKQLLNLASVMVLQPKVLILDEPTSQLDPIAASDFLATLGKINRELGTTILLTEHRLEEAFSFASRVAVMDKGTLLCTGTPADVGAELKASGNAMFLAMPAAMRIWAASASKAACPISVCDGRNWLLNYAKTHELHPISEETKNTPDTETVVSAQELWFKYEKDLPDVVKGLSLELHKGEFLALLGGNGTGKTTSMKLLAGLKKAYRGELTITGTVGMLPQNPQALFVKSTVRADLLEILPKSERKTERLAQVVSLCKLAELLDRHPYDLSGGEQQRAALAKILLLNPDILLLDEPTKGLDAEFKQVFGQILRTLQASGVAILMVSHDIEFCAKYADRCALFFDGNIVTESTPKTFFSGNSFYTTAANRIARDVLPDAVTPEDVIAACGGAVEPEAALPEYQRIPPAPEKATRTVKKLPVWRKILAAVSGAASLVLIAQAIGVTDLTKLIDANGMTALAGGQLKLYGILLAALLVFALSIGRKADRPDYLVQTPLEKRKLQKRTVTATLLILLLIPLTLFVGVYYFAGRKYYFISLLILLECMLPFFLIFEGRKPQARELVLIAVLVALNVAGRAAFFMLPEFKPVVAMTILAGVAFGGETGFLVGAMTMLVSNMLFSQGPWTPWQMFAMGIIGWLAGVLYRKGVLRRGRLSLCIFGVIASTIIYGSIMNPASALMWSNTINWKIILSSFPKTWISAFIYSVVKTHSEMTFVCQMTAQARSSRQQRSFFVQTRNRFAGLRVCIPNLAVDP